MEQSVPAGADLAGGAPRTDAKRWCRRFIRCRRKGLHAGSRQCGCREGIERLQHPQHNCQLAYNPSNQNDDGSAKVLSVTLQATNDLPVVTNVSEAASYHQGGDHILIASEALISDIDTTIFSGGAVKAELATPVAGENLLFVGGVSDAAALTLEGNNVIDGASKIVGQLSYVASGDDNVAVKISLTEEAGINDVQAILRGLAYRFDAVTTPTPFQTGTSDFTISVQDGAGVDVNGNIATTVSGAVVRTAKENNAAFSEGSSIASGERSLQVKSACLARST